MRYIITLLVVSLSFLGKAQSQALINYQGVARDSKGVAIANQAVALRFEILQGSASGPVVYTDNQLSGVVTNSLGLFSTQIGKSGNLAQVDWSNNGPYFCKYPSILPEVPTLPCWAHSKLYLFPWPCTCLPVIPIMY